MLQLEVFGGKACFRTEIRSSLVIERRETPGKESLCELGRWGSTAEGEGGQLCFEIGCLYGTAPHKLWLQKRCGVWTPIWHLFSACSIQKVEDMIEHARETRLWQDCLQWACLQLMEQPAVLAWASLRSLGGCKCERLPHLGVCIPWRQTMYIMVNDLTFLGVPKLDHFY